MRRDIAFGSIARTATGSVDVETVSLDGELRYGLPLGGGWAAGPIASIAYADADLGRFAETGAGSLNLSGAGGSDAATRYGAGAFANWQGARGGIDFSLQYVDGRSSLAEVDLALAGAAATPFSVRSPRADGAAALLGASGRYDLGGNWSLGANVRALVGGDGNDLSGAFTIGWRF